MKQGKGSYALSNTHPSCCAVQFLNPDSQRCIQELFLSLPCKRDAAANKYIGASLVHPLQDCARETPFKIQQ